MENGTHLQHKSSKTRDESVDFTNHSGQSVSSALWEKFSKESSTPDYRRSQKHKSGSATVNMASEKED
jgi:hypothetical protein